MFLDAEEVITDDKTSLDCSPAFRIENIFCLLIMRRWTSNTVKIIYFMDNMNTIPLNHLFTTRKMTFYIRIVIFY